MRRDNRHKKNLTSNVGIWFSLIALFVMLGCGFEHVEEQHEISLAASASKNRAPTVNVESQRTVNAESQQIQILPMRKGEKVVVNLLGQVTDDGLPSGHVTADWRAKGSRSSCAKSKCIKDKTDTVTQAEIRKAGTYSFDLVADDGETTGTDGVKVSVVRADFDWKNELVTPILFADTNRSIVNIVNPADDSEEVSDAESEDDKTTLTGRLFFDKRVPNRFRRAGRYSWTWKTVSGPGPVGLGSPDSVKTTVSFEEPGEYIFELTAKAEQWAATDTVVIDAVIRGNQPPRVRAGKDQVVSLSQKGFATVTIADSDVTDDHCGNQGIRTRWKQVSGPRPDRFVNRNSLSPTLDFTVPGRYELKLVVSETSAPPGQASADDCGESKVRYVREDHLTVHVLPSGANGLPLVFAGADKTVMTDPKGLATIVFHDAFLEKNIAGPVTVSWKRLNGPPEGEFDEEVELLFDLNGNPSDAVVHIVPGFDENRYVPPGMDASPEVYEFELSVTVGAVTVKDKVRVTVLQLSPPT